jgi:hypothetical protein
MVIASGAFASVASARSLKEIRAREAQDAALGREAAYTQSVCGNSFSASIDWRSAIDWPDGVSIVASCDGALGALEAMCRNKAGRAKAQRVTRFICAGDGSGASLNGGTLRYGASPGDNGFSETKAVLDGGL